MTSRFILKLSLIWITVQLGLIGCCPEPVSNGMQESSSPDSGFSSEVSPRLSVIQRQIFTPQCSLACHTGTAASAGLSLSAGESYSMIVNQPSQQIRSIALVSPGDPSRSYLVRKIEGSSSIVGALMPKLAPPLDEEAIAAIRQWIERGAPHD